MKRLLFSILVIIISGQLLYSQTKGKVVYGPKAQTTTEQALPSIGAGQPNVVVFNEATKSGAGYEPNPNQQGATDSPLSGQFTAFVSNSTPTSFTVTVADAPDCAGTYTVSCQPIAGSGPGGSTPPLTAITAYIGFPQGNFIFPNAGDGEYGITVTNTNIACTPPTNPLTFKGWPSIYTPVYVPVTAVANNITVPSFVFSHTGYTPDGHFNIQVSEVGSCDGTYTLWCTPVPNSAPDGTTPPSTGIIGYIGFPAGNFFFGNAGVGRYEISVTQTDPFTICNYTDNPLIIQVEIPDIRPIPLSNYALVLGIFLILTLAVLRIRKVI